ncbi:DUF4293 domain-containing protein [uncultured Mucilaginibacter sp.]|uniref:DUF4293 domain-containing protein n=1 Tax=uncultured Mucilaginibacter sp. TaxID=797541 RepID=UPI0025EC9B18|nr:DUF4293 domain-containing protein [uncultured Mucilaginibacter sp.]
MIQRIQSTYLFLAALAVFALFFLPLAHHLYIGNTETTFKVDGQYQDMGGQLVRTVSFLPMTIVCVILGLLPIIIIFRYKERGQQIALCYGLILALIGFSFWMTQTVKQLSEGVVFKVENYSYGVLMPSVSIIFVLLAIKNIRNDEKLVKSADRLR